MSYDIQIILIRNKYMIKKSWIIKRWKEKYTKSGDATQGSTAANYNLPACFFRYSREGF